MIGTIAANLKFDTLIGHQIVFTRQILQSYCWQMSQWAAGYNLEPIIRASRSFLLVMIGHSFWPIYLWIYTWLELKTSALESRFYLVADYTCGRLLFKIYNCPGSWFHTHMIVISSVEQQATCCLLFSPAIDSCHFLFTGGNHSGFHDDQPIVIKFHFTFLLDLAIG